MPKRGQRQPYRVFTTFPPSERNPEGRRSVDAYVSLSDADHNGRQCAGRGGTSEMLYLHEDGQLLRMFVYTPDNAPVFDEDAELAPIYKETDIIRWYRKHHGPAEVLNGVTVRNIRSIDRPVPDGTPTDKTVPRVYPQDEDVQEPPAWMTRHNDGAPTDDDANDEEEPMPTDEPQTDEAQTSASLTDEELWNSPIGQRLRHYADKLLAAEGERIQLVAKRQWESHVRGGVERARAIVSPLGDPRPLGLDPDEVPRSDTDPWADWQSPEVVGLREAITATDGTIPAVQEAAKAYIASFQGEERPADEDAMPVGPPWTGDEEPPADEEPPVKREATPTDVVGALSYLLTGHAVSDRGPFAVHQGDGFHAEPYVILPLDAMRKVLDEIPQDRW